MHEARLAKAHFEFLRMRVDVDARRVHFEVQHVGRVAAVEQHVAIREPHGAGDELVAQRPAVQEEMLLVGLAARVGRQAEPAVQAHAGRLS